MPHRKKVIEQRIVSDKDELIPSVDLIGVLDLFKSNMKGSFE